MRRAPAQIASVALLFLVGCTGSGVKTDYILAERLWEEKSYLPAARQFERVFQRDQEGRLGQQALYRAATTRLLFLKDYDQALKLFTKYLEVAPQGPAARDARLEIGEIYFSRTNQYDEAIRHYSEWLADNPTATEAPGIQLRIGRAQFFLWRFTDAIRTFEALIARAPRGPLAAEAAYQIGVWQLSLASHPESASPGDEQEERAAPDSLARHRLAIQAFERVEREFPGTPAAQEAGLGIAASLEERGLWEEALQKIEELGRTRPESPILKIRKKRIQDRLARRMAGPRR